jgi:hydroxymethylpyrimidine/phosphomethylpyrimidine kinase
MDLGKRQIGPRVALHAFASTERTHGISAIVLALFPRVSTVAHLSIQSQDRGIFPFGAVMKSILVIAASESSGRAGVAVDLRTAAAMGVHAQPVLTAISAQRPGEIELMPCDPGLVRDQIAAARAVAQPAAIKIGLLPTPELVRAVAESLSGFDVPIVLDPVLSSSGGGQLVSPEVGTALMELLGHVSLLTPNLPELSALLGQEVGHRDADLEPAARQLMAGGCDAVLVTGGHRDGDADDLLVTSSGS